MSTLLSFRQPGGTPSVAAAEPAVPAARRSWEAVHALLTGPAAEACPPPAFANLTAYHYCVHQALERGKPLPTMLSRRFDQLAAQLAQQANQGAWPVAQLDQACVAAWLNTQLATNEHPRRLTLSTRLDEALCAEARHLHQQPDAESQRRFWRVLRYFSLRLPAAAEVLPVLQSLLAHPPPPPAEPLALGLVEGVAAELLLLLKLHKAGLRHASLVARIRAGISKLLAVRHPVDFLEGHYSVFPHQLLPASEEGTFSAELSWQRGDLGQSLLLYKAHELLQDDELIKIAELVGLNTLLRTTAPATGIGTAELARGAAGVAHLYRKLYQASRLAAYREGYRHWLGQTHILLRQDLAAGRYQGQEGNLLHGLVGIGLVTVASLTDAELDWDALVL